MKVDFFSFFDWRGCFKKLSKLSREKLFDSSDYSSWVAKASSIISLYFNSFYFKRFLKSL